MRVVKTNQASPSLILIFPSATSSAACLSALEICTGLIGAPEVEATGSSAIIGPGGKRPFHSTFRLISSTAEAERSFATTYL